jgi:sigma-B regulation protein RsbQ
MSILARHNVHVSGSGARTILFAHGFGCDQNMWRYVAPEFEHDHEVVLFDHLGSGKSDLAQYDPRRHATLDGYATDVIELAGALGGTGMVFVGHSVSAMIGVLASVRAPDLFSRLILVGPSPRYLNDGDYVGGFEPADIDGLLEVMDSNYLGWSKQMAPVIMGNAARPELGEELAESFCRNDPDIARQFARVTFQSDNRADLPRVRVPTLVLQCTDDAIAPDVVGEYVHRAIPDSRIVRLAATGHCPNLSAPVETAAAIREFLT